MAQISADEIQAIASIMAALAAGVAGWVGGSSGKKARNKKAEEDEDAKIIQCKDHGGMCEKLAVLPQILEVVKELKTDLNDEYGVFHRLRIVESKTDVLEALSRR